MYAYAHTYSHIITIDEKEAMSLTERKEGYMERFGGRKEKGRYVVIISKTKNK